MARSFALRGEAAVRGGPASTTQERKPRAYAAGHRERSLSMFSAEGTAL